MFDRIAMSRLGFATVGLGCGLLAAVATAPDATAQEATISPAASEAEGRFIYSRAVHHSVGAPYFPGPTASVVTGPTGVITGAIANGLTPLTDEESGAVAAALARPTAISWAVDAGLAPRAGFRTGAAAGERAGGSTGGTISDAMGSLTSALGALRSALGSRP